MTTPNPNLNASVSPSITVSIFPNPPATKKR
jgi:hypothetical protein